MPRFVLFMSLGFFISGCSGAGLSEGLGDAQAPQTDGTNDLAAPPGDLPTTDAANAADIATASEVTPSHDMSPGPAPDDAAGDTTATPSDVPKC